MTEAVDTDAANTSDDAGTDSAHGSTAAATAMTTNATAATEGTTDDPTSGTSGASMTSNPTTSDPTGSSDSSDSSDSTDSTDSSTTLSTTSDTDTSDTDPTGDTDTTTGGDGACDALPSGPGFRSAGYENGRIDEIWVLEDKLFVVASGGLVEYSNGEWSAHTELDNVSAVGGGGPGQHVWAKIWDAVHDIARYDGDGWCAYKMSNYGVTDIWVLADDDIWTLGNTTIGHWDGVKWTHKYDYEGGRDLWGTSDEDMWFVGSGAAHWNGSEIEPYPAAPLIYSIYGNAADNVWLKTSSSLMRYIGGDSWLQYPTSEFSGGDVWIDQETGKGWAVGGSLGKARLYEGDGDDWTLSDYAPDSKTLAGVHGSGLDNVWAFGETLLQYDGQTWKDWELGTKLYEYDSIYAVSATEAWASSLNRVRHFTNGDLQPSEVIEGIPGKAIHGSSGADIWSVGSLGKIAHYNGDSWSIVNSPTSNHLYAVWAHTPSVAWAGGKSHLLRWDGQSWSIVYTTPNAETIFAIWGTAADDVWAVGGPDLILHWDGLTWKKIMLIDGPWGFTLRDVWGLEADDMYAVGYRGAAGVYYRFDGAVWKQLDSSLDRSFNAIRRSPKGELWVGGTYKDPREYGLLYRNEDLDGWQPEDEMLLLDPSRSWIEHMSNSPDGTTTWLVSDRNVYVYQ